jgi:hypothetical protein
MTPFHFEVAPGGYLQIKARDRKFARNKLIADNVVGRMRRDGLVLHCENQRETTRWHLSTGEPVDRHVALILVSSGAVVPGGDALFPNTTSQTYRAHSPLSQYKELKL